MKKTVLTFVALVLLATGVAGVFVPVADAADSTYWHERIASIEGSDLSENEKEFKIKLIRIYMGRQQQQNADVG